MAFWNFLTKEIAIDLGTANTLVMFNDKVVVDEPSIVAMDRTTGRVIAVGREALQMHEKTHENIRTIRPLRDGVIADFTVAEHMIRHFIKKLQADRKFLGANLKMVICIPSGITEVEKRAVKDSAEHAGAKEIYLIHEPMAAALGIGIDVESHVGHMIVDIGGGTTEIAVIALGGIVCDQSIRIAGDELNNNILTHMRRQHNLDIGEKTAERIKINVGSAKEDLPNPPEPYEAHGRDVMTGIPKKVTVTYQEISRAISVTIGKIEEAVLKALEQTPPELSADIYEQGIHLTGGGALLRGLDVRLSERTKLPVHVAEDPLRAVVRGTGIALKNYNRYKFLLM
jgi:rod shape-determining protein MreB